MMLVAILVLVQTLATAHGSRSMNCPNVPQIEVEVPDDLLGLSIRELTGLVAKLANERNKLHRMLAIALTPPVVMMIGCKVILTPGGN